MFYYRKGGYDMQKKYLIKHSNNIEVPNAISMNDIETELKKSNHSEMLDPSIWEKLTQCDYADIILNGIIIRNSEPQPCIIEVHEYLCIDENDPEFNNSRCAVFIIPINKNKEMDNFYTFDLINGDSDYVENLSMIGEARIINKDSNEYEQIVDFLKNESENDKIDKKLLMYL